jgi:hypothetical protein
LYSTLCHVAMLSVCCGQTFVQVRFYYVYYVTQVVGNFYLSHQQWKVLMSGIMTLFHVMYCIFARNLCAKQVSVTLFYNAGENMLCL